jgi:hypothetical protein
MTLGAIWCNYEEASLPRLWMATDSRISDEGGRLIDEGIKLYEVPVVCRRPGESGFFDVPFFATSVGMCGAGGSLIYQHVYGTLGPILSNLIGNGSAVPSVADIALLASELTTRYVRSLGHRRPDADRVTIVIGGDSIGGRMPEAYRLRPGLNSDRLIHFSVEPLSLEPDVVHFVGDRITHAQTMLREIAEENEPGAPRARAALNVIRAFIDDPDISTIGGEVQIGYTMGNGFHRVASVRPDWEHPPTAIRLLNSIDLDALPHVGPCGLGIQGMVSP